MHKPIKVINVCVWAATNLEHTKVTEVTKGKLPKPIPTPETNSGITKRHTTYCQEGGGGGARADLVHSTTAHTWLKSEGHPFYRQLKEGRDEARILHELSLAREPNKVGHQGLGHHIFRERKPQTKCTPPTPASKEGVILSNYTWWRLAKWK